MTVRPQRVVPVGGASRVDQALLGDQHVRPRRMPSAGGDPLRRRDLLEAPAQVHGGRSAALLGQPRHRPRQRVVELEHARPVAKPAEPRAVPRRQLVTGDGEQLARSHVEQHLVGRRQIGHRTAPHAPARSRRPATADTPAIASVIACEPPRATGHPTLCPRPSNTSANAAVGGRLSGSIEWAAMPASSARARSPRNRRPEQRRADQSVTGKAGGRQRMPRQPRRSQDQIGDLVPVTHQRAHQ